jgi:hypothetical protein
MLKIFFMSDFFSVEFIYLLNTLKPFLIIIINQIILSNAKSELSFFDSWYENRLR